MAHSIRTLRWLDDLLARGEIRPGASVLEFGHQDITRYAPDSDDERALTQGCAVAKDWYAKRGFGAYASVDRYDERASWRWDLNEPHPSLKPASWDLVYDGGTAEHIFNIAQVFRTAHELCTPGGLMLYCLPVTDVDHGFWGVQLSVYRGLADANGYAIVDLFAEDIDGAAWKMLGVDRPNPDKLYGFAALRRPLDDLLFAYPQQRP